MARFWKAFQEALGTIVNLSIAFHSQIDGELKETIKFFEGMLRTFVLDFGGRWEW